MNAVILSRPHPEQTTFNTNHALIAVINIIVINDHWRFKLADVQDTLVRKIRFIDFENQKIAKTLLTWRIKKDQPTGKIRVVDLISDRFLYCP
jgi:hypothetical protein